jgi:hypothetical protein
MNNKVASKHSFPFIIEAKVSLCYLEEGKGREGKEKE